jgi:hypothetical protein
MSPQITLQGAVLFVALTFTQVVCHVLTNCLASRSLIFFTITTHSSNRDLIGLFLQLSKLPLFVDRC